MSILRAFHIKAVHLRFLQINVIVRSKIFNLYHNRIAIHNHVNALYSRTRKIFRIKNNKTLNFGSSTGEQIKLDINKQRSY